MSKKDIHNIPKLMLERFKMELFNSDYKNAKLIARHFLVFFPKHPLYRDFVKILFQYQ